MRYEPALDGLRALAVLAVIAYHAAGLRGGWAGVDIFFTLSGFLITNIVEGQIAAGRFHLGAFYRRRMLRLQPAFFLMAAAVVILTLTRNDGPHLRTTALIALTYTMNWRRTWDMNSLVPFDHTWSLAIEAQFYLLWPLFLLLMPAQRKLPAACLSLALVLGWRWYLIAHGASEPRVYNGLDTHADSLLAGCILALVARNGRPSALSAWRGWLPLPPLFALVCLTAGPASLIDRWGLTLATVLSSTILLLARSGGALTRLLSVRPLVYIGRISYGVYLWQGAVLFWLRLKSPHDAVDASVFAVLAATISIVLASVSYYLVERPVLRWRDRPAGRTGTLNVGYRPSAACAAASRAIGTR